MGKAQKRLFVAAIFMGSFLLFLVQPMVARLALPKLGGAPNVWNSAMLVYQALLLGGYAYAHAIGRLAIKRQFMLHVALLLLAALTLPIALREVPSFGAGREVLWVPALLFASIGPVFFLVSSQAPMIQRWYAQDPQAADPYPLYAASNLGSFTGLLSYPFLIEPLLSLRAQSVLWSMGYGLLVLLVVIVARARWSVASTSIVDSPAIHLKPIGWRRIALWLVLAAVPSGLMLSTTTHLTTDIFAMPLLWVIPLGLYLLSYVPAFAEDRRFARVISRAAPIILLLAGSLAMMSSSGGGMFSALAAVVMLFVICVALHARLYDARPEPARLTLFYLVMSAGGVLGGLFTALLAPAIFDWVWEHPILVLLAAMLIPLGTLPRWQQKIADSQRLRMIALAAIMLLGVGGSIALMVSVSGGSSITVFILLIVMAAMAMAVKFNRFAFVMVLALMMGGRGGAGHIGDYKAGERTRSYFGAYKVVEVERAGVRELVHGTTVHGRQLLAEDERLKPTAYYGETSGAGLVLRNASGLFGPQARVGIVGLGAGTLACYREPQQIYRFYEIDPAILAFSEQGKFTFMAECAPNAKTIIGDARIKLEAEPAGQFDILAVDAFSSDAIPLHLLTREAMAAYSRAVGPDGVVLIHISNRFVTLEPVLASILEAGEWTGAIRNDRIANADGLTPSLWLVAAKDPAAIDAIKAASGKSEWRDLVAPAGEPWTDDYASTLPHIRWNELVGILR
jgi:SAM-dependent methyltransferase